MEKFAELADKFGPQARVPCEDVEWFYRKLAAQRRALKVPAEIKTIREEDFPINEN